jgi:subtilisin family serine protease
MFPDDITRLRVREESRLARRTGPGGQPAATWPTSVLLRQPHTVIVKLQTAPAAMRRLTAAVRGEAVAEQPFLSTLVENGYAQRIDPVFPSTMPLPETRAPLRRLAATVEIEQPLQAARGLVSLQLDPHTNADELVAHLNKLGDEVAYAYVPPIKHLCGPAAPSRRRRSARNDPLSARQWGHGAVRIRQARARASFVDAQEVIVAIVDTGIDEEHPDLDGSIHSYENFLATEDKRDYKGHGTHVAGIIAAEINNAIGIAGLCAARIMALKGLPRNGNDWDAAAYYRALAHPITAGAKVLNLSLGGGLDPGERDVITDVMDAGICVVAAMGNEFEEGNPISYPAAYDGVCAVGASDEVDRRASFSCTGKHIALVAPGERILSTTPRYPSDLAQSVLYDSWPGTSMATPHVAAAAALLLAKSPNLTPKGVRQRLTETADRVRWQAQRPDEEYGWGRLNIEAALK